jgi:hypothetical protein
LFSRGAGLHAFVGVPVVGVVGPAVPVLLTDVVSSQFSLMLLSVLMLLFLYTLLIFLESFLLLLLASLLLLTPLLLLLLAFLL